MCNRHALSSRFICGFCVLCFISFKGYDGPIKFACDDVHRGFIAKLRQSDGLAVWAQPLCFDITSSDIHISRDSTKEYIFLAGLWEYQRNCTLGWRQDKSIDFMGAVDVKFNNDPKIVYTIPFWMKMDDQGKDSPSIFKLRSGSFCE